MSGLIAEDKTFCRRRQPARSRLRAQVENPHTWTQEVTTMNQNQLREKRLAEPQPREEESFRAHLDRIFQYKEGKGNFTEERHQQPMPDVDTIVKRILAAREAKQAAERHPPEK
ncbi:hypothetical protein C6495_02870 [Candidatus Poribacteria bacterium]|nr:MAG: hypothetical protein C6495_02870 [Candidatus Poribacteria bacterium]